MFSASELLIVAKALHKWTHKTKPVGIPSDQNGVGIFIMKNWHLFEVETHMIYLYINICWHLLYHRGGKDDLNSFVWMWAFQTNDIWFFTRVHLKTSRFQMRYVVERWQPNYSNLVKALLITLNTKGAHSIHPFLCISLVYQTLLNQHHQLFSEISLPGIVFFKSNSWYILPPNNIS